MPDPESGVPGGLWRTVERDNGWGVSLAENEMKGEVSLKLEKFLNLERPEHYDFREEIMVFRDSDDAVDRMMIYQAVGIGENRGKYRDKWGFDNADRLYQGKKLKEEILISGEEADSCPLLRELFQRQFPGREVSGDTMCSFSSTANEIFKEKEGPAIFDCKKWGKVATVGLYASRPDRVRAILNSYGAANYLKAAYTIGNFIPVPSGFQRRGMGPSKDYWDLALMCIYNYYAEKKRWPVAWPQYTLTWLLSGNKKALPLCKEWLDSYKIWDAFVEGNFLQEFVNQEGNGYGKPKELWKGHFTSSILPEEDGQSAEFFTNAAAWITARGTRIAGTLAKSLGSTEKQERDAGEGSI